MLPLFREACETQNRHGRTCSGHPRLV